jgi:hypothetical protein
MFLFAGSLHKELIERVEKDLRRFALREDSHSDMNDNTDNNVINNCDMKNRANSFFTEIKEHLVRVGDPFLMKAFENYLPFKQENNSIEQGDEDKFTHGLKMKEQLYAKQVHLFLSTN